MPRLSAWFLPFLLAPSLLAGCDASPKLPVIAEVPDFSLTDEEGELLTRDALKGDVWVANFMFTSCPDICPVLTTKMAGLRTRLRGDGARIRYVSLSVDPGTDSPEVLKRYAIERGADYDDWSFLTGEIGAVKRVVVGGFKQSIEKGEVAPGKPQTILHGSHFVLVDQRGRIRGFYRSDDEGLLTLARDARLLLAAGAEG